MTYRRILLMVLTLAVGCGGHQKALRRSFAVLEASATGFDTWDRTTQDRIVDEAASYPDALRGLERYRGARAPVLAAFAAAYRLLAVASLARDAESDAAVESVRAAVQAAINFRRAIDKLRTKDPDVAPKPLPPSRPSSRHGRATPRAS